MGPEALHCRTIPEGIELCNTFGFLYLWVAALQNAEVDDYERRQGLLRGIKAAYCGNVAAELARRIKREPSYVNRLFYDQGKDGAKGIGQEIMDACREAFQLPRGFWDMTVEEAFPERSPLALTAPKPTAYLPGFEALSVPVLATAASMGPGSEMHDDVVIGRLTLRPDWVTKTLKSLSKLENLRFIHGYGDSMEPTFIDGDILLVDSGSTAVTVDGIYVLEANDRLYIKRVRQRLDGSYEISSDSPKVKTVDVLDGRQEVVVKGRVVWVWNGKKM